MRAGLVLGIVGGILALFFFNSRILCIFSRLYHCNISFRRRGSKSVNVCWPCLERDLRLNFQHTWRDIDRTMEKNRRLIHADGNTTYIEYPGKRVYVLFSQRGPFLTCIQWHSVRVCKKNTIETNTAGGWHGDGSATSHYLFPDDL